MIIEESLNGWNNKPVKTAEVVYPQSKDDKAPKNYFLGIFCGSRGSGKSYLFTKLLKTLED
jgi:pantothenate kinase-related protein Tda10